MAGSNRAYEIENAEVDKAVQEKSGKSSLRRIAIRGSAFEILGYGSGQVLRLGSNVILSHLLFPEAFGLAALVTIFMLGLVMLSDVGLQTSIIHNDRGDEPDFLNTAWTIQVARGFLLWLLAIALAWPVSKLYNAPELVWLLPVGSLSVIFAGFNSTSIFTLRRRLRIGLVNIIELGSYLICVIVMVVWALISPSVWALVAGGLTNAACKMLASHFVPVGYHNRILWEKQAALEIIHFGKWIFGSSAITFFGRQGDRLLLGRYLGMSVLGIYSIALILSDAIGTAVNRVTFGVIFPAFSRIRHEGHDRIKTAYYQTRLRLDLIALPPLGALTMLGSWVVDLLYDDRYSEAGWILELLCIRVAMSCVLAMCEVCLFSIGQPRWGFYANVGRTLWVMGGIPIFFALGGIEGIVWVMALSEIPALLILWIPFYREKLLRIKRELLALAFFGAGIAIGALLKLPLEALTAGL